MSTGEADDRLGVAGHLVPVGMGVVTWLLAAIVLATLLSMDSVSFGSLVRIGALVVLFVPVYRFRPWESGLTERVHAFAERRRFALGAAAGLFVLVRLPVVSELLAPLVPFVLFPLRAAPQLLFGAKVFYGARLGDLAGEVLFGAGRLYVEFLWLFVLGAGVEWLAQRGGE